MGRKFARESAMKLLFQMEANNDFTENIVDLFMANNELNGEDKDYIFKTVNKIVQNKEEIDRNIEKYSQGWRLNRMPKVDLAVLRIAVFEIMYEEEIPIEVSINEAIDIVKKYSTSESSKFVNGLLGGLVRDRDDNNG
ncbi:transcription antitermination factor NusB [Brassicibacter mesophilus]|jgi:transcription antitermination protein NusB|uniref:transcription antitermination factor NusB n=1 Tax=Brassicibacter mesophilus TaxID=745119 RepID=UPI003D1D780D